MDTRITGEENPQLPALMALCVGSGAAALIYQVIWFQLLTLVIGASSVSLGVLLATFMGGMCIGSLAFGRFVSARLHPIKLLAVIEFGIGILGLVVLLSMPAIGKLYAALAGPNSSGIAAMSLRSTFAAICLLPATVLMGATLPAIARWFGTTPVSYTRIGFCYGANLLGAVAGSLLAGFYLLRVHDVTIATYVAAAINAAVGIAALWLASHGGYTRLAGAPDKLAFSKSATAVYVATGLSGMTALAAEVIWTRHLSLLLGATVYTFALVLAVFLFGLGIGSHAGALLSQRIDPRAAFGYCQLLLCLAIVWGAYAVMQWLPYWPVDVTLPAAPSVRLLLDLTRTACVVLPASLLWGASFPLALAAAASRQQDPGRLLGGLYAANTLGAIFGALVTSFVLIVSLGSQSAQRILIGAAAISGLLLIMSTERFRNAVPSQRATVLAAVAAIVAVTVGAVPTLPGEFVAYGRFLPTRGLGTNIIFLGEGLTASVAVSEEPDGTLTYHSAGKTQASTYPQDMRLQRMLGHLTTLVPESGENYLVIGLGAGVTAGAVSIDPNARHVVVVDIEPLAQTVASDYFRTQNYGVADRPNVELIVDDGRHFLSTTDATFDGITTDPLDPWVKGAAALYTREFWELVRMRLNPGGVVTVFVQLYETTEAAVKSELATFFDVFPNGAVFANTVQGTGYDVVLLASRDDAPVDADRIDNRLGHPEYRRVAESLHEVGFQTATDLLGTYAGRAQDLSSWLAQAEVNTDRNLRLQYLAGQGLNLYNADLIFQSMQATAVIDPADYFRASPRRLRELEQIVNARQGRF